MGAWIASQIVKLMIHKNLTIKDSKVLCLGITFKENCPDIRNSKTIDLITELNEYGCLVDIYDPLAKPEELYLEYGLRNFNRINDITNKKYSAIVLAVAHHQFKDLNLEIYKQNNSCVIYDIKSVLPTNIIDKRL